MITVKYKIREGYGELLEISGSGRIIEFRLGDEAYGRLSLGGREGALEDGRCRLDTSGLSFGEYLPMLLTVEGTVKLEPIVINGERISAAPTAEWIHRITLERISALEEKAKIQEERINELTTLIKGTALFG